jgi:hypothetical protein
MKIVQSNQNHRKLKKTTLRNYNFSGLDSSLNENEVLKAKKAQIFELSLNNNSSINSIQKNKLRNRSLINNN